MGKVCFQPTEPAILIQFFSRVIFFLQKKDKYAII